MCVINHFLFLAKTLPVPLHDRCSASKSNDELIKAAYTANKQYGPCTVQKVQLKNGQTMFAYTPERTPGSSSANSDSAAKSPVSPNVNNVRKLDDAFGESKNTASKKQKTIPEEIVLSDSEDESDDKQNASAAVSSSVPDSNLSVASPKQTAESCGEQKQVEESDSDDDAMYIDESDSQNTNNSCL